MYEYRCKVVKIIDGDTVDVDIDLGFGVWLKKERIRLYAIDTPESRTRDLEEKKLGKLATERTRQLLEDVSAKSGYFRLKSHGVGKYGRVLGELFVMDVDGNQWNVNETLIAEGHAYIYDGGTKKIFKK